jgi:hypothetical protein
VNAADALRFVHFQSLECRTRDAHEALCLLLPAILKALDLDPMDGFEASAFRHQLKAKLTNGNFRNQNYDRRKIVR